MCWSSCQKGNEGLAEKKRLLLFCYGIKKLITNCLVFKIDEKQVAYIVTMTDFSFSFTGLNILFKLFGELFFIVLR